MNSSQNNIINELVDDSHSKLAKSYLSFLSNNPERIFILDDEKKYSGKKIISRVIKFCNELSKYDHEVVLLKSSNTTEWVLFYLAAKLKNKTVFIISETADKNTLKLLHSNFKISFIFENNKLIKFKEKIQSNTYSNLNNLEKRKSYDCIFTTGTTGSSKGVFISQDAYLHTAKALINKSEQSIDDVELLSMPFSHSFGLARLRSCILNNQTIYISDGLKNFPKIYKKFIDGTINGLSLVPAAIEIIKSMLRKNSADFGLRVKYFEIGSSALSYESRKWLKSNFKNTIIFHHYGMTEASRSFFIDRGYKDNLTQKKNYVGSVCSNEVTFKIHSKNNEDKGEIYIKGPHLADSFFTLATKIKIEKIDGWFKTNDLGIIKNNKLIICGRLNSMINVGGQKVYAEEVEDFSEKLEEVSKALCFAMFDEILGEVPVIIVEIHDSSSKPSEEIISKIKNHFQLLQSYKRPKKISIVKKIPLTKNGKKSRNMKTLEKYL